MAKESWKTREATAKSQKNASAKSTSQSSQKSGSSRADYNRNFFNSEMEKYQTYDRDTFRAASLYEFQQKQDWRRGRDLYDDFNRQASAFDRAVARDLSDESGFNAAQYFEERQKQANALKQRADTLKLFMEDHMDLYTPEFYDPLMENMSTFNTKVDDVLAQYKPSLESKAGMRAYEDELLAAMERDKKLNADGNLGVNDNWSAEQRYRLGLMQMTDPNEAKKYAAAVNAGQDPYLLYQQQEQQKANWRAMDLVAEKREIDRLKAELDNYYWNSDYDATSVNERNAFDQEIKRREKEISDREQQYNLAKREQENAQFQSATERSDFASRSGYVGTGFEMPTYVEDADPDELVYEYINDPGVRKQINQQTTDLAAKGYDLLNEEEIGIYNYYYATEGPLKAQQYLDNIQDTLNQRIGERGAAAKSGDLWKQLMTGTIAGYSNAVTSPQYFFDKDSEYINTNPSQYMSAAIREDMDDTGPVLPGVLGGASLGQMAFDLANTTANMAPSILLSTAANAIIPGSGAFVGAVTMGSSAAGGAYQQALNAGYSKEQARNYAALAGASEVGLEYLLGGISKLGGEIPQNVLREIVGSVDNAIAKAAITLGGSMASEGFEEGLQEIITPWLENLVLYADKDVNWNDVAYSTLLGALSGGVMEGPGVVSNTVMTSRRNKLLMDLARSKVDAENASVAEEQPAPQEQETKKPTEKPAVSKEGRSIQISTESPIDTMDFAEIKNGKATIQLKDGGTVDYSDVSFATEAEANQYYAVSTLPGIETEAANDLLHTIQEAGAGQDDQGIIAVREAYRLGYAGAQASELANSDAAALSPDLRQKVFEIGQSQRRADAMAKPTVRESAIKPTEGYKKVVIEGKISKPNKKTQKKWDAEIALMDYIADNFSGNAVHVYESYKGMDGKYYYRDSNGKVNRAPNGMYVNGEIWVDLRSGDNQEGLVLNTFAHEMYHHIERFDKAKAQELAEFVVKELGMESVDKAVEAQIQKARKAGLSEAYFMNVKGMTAEQARNEVYMRAMSDFVADSLETMFTRGDPAKAIADLKKENRTLFDQIKAFIDKWVSKLKDFYKDKTVSEEGAVVAQLKNFEQLQKLFMEGVQSAGENYRAAVESLTPGEAGEVFNEDGDPVAMSTEDGSVMLSIRTYEEDGRKAFRNYLQKCVSSKRLTETQMQEMIDGIEEVYQICKEFKDKYAPFSAWSDAEVIRDTRGRPVFSVVTPNGDYKMNLDFSLVCKKRRTLDAVFNEMSRRGIIDDFELGQKSVVKINEIIRKYGLETACALCFVDAKRFRQASMADSFTRLYNELVESLVPEDQKGSIDHFNFSGYDTIKKVEGGIDTWDNSRLDFSHLDDVMKRYGKGTVEHKAARYIKNNPKGRKLLLRGDFMSSQGFDAVKTQNRDILKLYNSKKGTGGPKAAFGDVQYLNEIIKKSRTWTPAKAYEVGGVRIQSFSDYVPRMVFDYTQMIYDLAATKLPAHAYTKESLFVKQFGLTGVKINMSLIPAIAEGGIAPGLDANGNYAWAGESFDYDTAVEIQNAEGYTENCGTICVGVSKQHIEKLLRDPNIRMVIPYHKSGLNPIVAHMNKIAEFTDYTNDQRTKGKDGKAISNEFNFNESVKRNGDPKAAADKYLKWCMANGYTAKFAEFAAEENYYKLLEDFTLYDKDGNYVPQREVRAVFPAEGSAFGTMKDLIESGLEEDAVVEGKRDSNLSAIVDEIQRTLPKTEAEIGEEQVAQANRDLEAFSLRNEKPATDRDILMNLDANAQKVSVKGHLQRYQDRLTKLAELEPVHEDLKAQIEGLSQAEKPNYKEINRLKSEERRIRVDVNQMNGMVRSFERSDMGKRLVAEERLKIQKAEFKSFREEQKALARANTAEQRLIREELTGVTSIMTVMEDEFIKLAKDYEEQKIDLKTMEEEFMRLANEYDKQTKDVNIWEREFKRLLKEYDTIKGQRERAKAKVETLQKQDQRKKVESQVKSLMKMLKNPTKDAHIPMALQEPLRKFLDSIDFTSRRQASGGSPTIKDIAYAKALRAIHDAVASQRTAMDVTDGAFALDVPAEFLDRIENHIKVIEEATDGLNLTTNRVYEMRSEELKELNHILTVINKAIRQIDKFHLQGERARISGYAKETVQEMESRKPIKGEDGNKYLWGNSTPWYAFRRYGKAGQKIFKGLMQGQAKLAENIDSIVKFAEETYTNKEVREWERKRHTIKLDSGKAVTMSTAQIMSFWCLSNRDQAIPHMQGGGMRPTTLKKSVDGTNVQNEMVQKEHFTLTRADVNRINNLLTGRQREVAGKLQQFMQTVGGRFVNEVSMARWDYMAATETDYFPIQTDDTGRDVKNPEQERASLFALLNKSFTKAPVKNSRNALVVDSIFNVFANHMSETAEYNAFALPLVDAMKWFNYNERIDVGDGHIKDVSVHNAIKNTLGKNAKQYFIDLMTDINSSQKAGRYEDFFGKILGRSKVSSVAWNTRVAIQQLSALPRASMVLKPRYLLASVSKFRLQYAVKEMKKYSGIALWKSMGYYDLNVARSVERQIKHDTSFLDQFNETGMWLPGKMDERTWAKIWIATREQIKNERNLSGEELLRATAELFEEIVYQTQVADSVLTRSSFMRSKSQLIKEATSFMAEPTLATNILIYAFEDYETGHTTLEKAKRGLMIGFTGYALSAVANALLGSLSDAWRDDDEYETYWEKYGQALFGSKEKFFTDGNLFSELNPLEKFIFVKDLLSVAKGFEPNSSYSKLISGMLDLVYAYQSVAEGKTTKTAYGVVYQTLQYLSTVSGVGISNITREVVDVWNNTFGKWNPDQKLVRYQSDNGEELLNALQKGTPEDIQRVFGRFENQQKAESALQSAIGEQYRDGKLTAEEAEKLLTENFDRDDEHEVYWILDKWDYAKKNGSSEGYLKYSKFLEGVETGTFETEMDRLLQNGSDASDIRSEITKKYRKQYLEDETAREGIRQKLRPVFEATGMYDDEIQDKFHDWDFEAEYGVTYSEMKAEYRDGNITEAEMREAMDFYGLLNYEITEAIRSLNEDIAFKKKYGMSLSEMKDAYDRGDLAQNQMKNALVFTGMTQNEAKNWIKQRSISNQMGINYTELDDAYMYGDISRSNLRNSILKNGETVKNTDEAMMGYDWLKKNIKKYPDLAIDDAKKFAVRIHPDYAPDETLEDYGVSIDAYIEYQRLRPECKGMDVNGDGKTDDGTLRDSIFQMIDSLSISSEAKDGLALMSYSAKSIRRNAPWH